MIETILGAVALLVGAAFGAAVVAFVWTRDRQTLEKLFLAELTAANEERRALLSMIRSQNNKLISKDLAVFTSLEGAETQATGTQSRRRDDATEARFAGGNGVL